MPNTDFKKRWFSIRKAMYEMGYTKLKNFDDLRTCSLDPYLTKQVELINKTLKSLEDEKCDKASLANLSTQLTNMKGKLYIFF